MVTPIIQTQAIWLLDRNAVAILKDAVAGKPQTDAKKAEALERLRALDVPQNSITPLLSIIEGERGREDTVEEKVGCLEKETDVVGDFFKQAGNDAVYLDGQKLSVAALFAGVRESLWEERAEFLLQAAPLVVQKVPVAKRFGVENQLIALARGCELSPNDGVVMLFLACLYGSDAARKVLKPNRPHTYNVLSDLHVIPRIGMIEAVARMQPSPLEVHFWTLDDGLATVKSHICIAESRISEEGELQMKVAYLPPLFPDLVKGDDDSAAIAMLHRIADAAASHADGATARA